MTTTDSTTLLTRPDVERITGLSCSSIYRLMRESDFPEPLQIGRSVRWRDDEVQDWISRLPRATGMLAR